MRLGLVAALLLSVPPLCGSPATPHSLSDLRRPVAVTRFAAACLAPDGLGTLLSDQRNFVVLYTGTVDHPGGELGFREQDDGVEDAVEVGIEDEFEGKGAFAVRAANQFAIRLGVLLPIEVAVPGPDHNITHDRDGEEVAEAVRGQTGCGEATHRDGTPKIGQGVGGGV